MLLLLIGYIMCLLYMMWIKFKTIVYFLLQLYGLQKLQPPGLQKP